MNDSHCVRDKVNKTLFYFQRFRSRYSIGNKNFQANSLSTSMVKIARQNFQFAAIYQFLSGLFQVGTLNKSPR